MADGNKCSLKASGAHASELSFGNLSIVRRSMNPDSRTEKYFSFFPFSQEFQETLAPWWGKTPLSLPHTGCLMGVNRLTFIFTLVMLALSRTTFPYHFPLLRNRDFP